MALYKIAPDVVDARQLTGDEDLLTDRGPTKGYEGQWYVTRLVEGVVNARLYDDDQFKLAFSLIAE